MQQPHKKPPGQCYTQEGILLLPPSRLPGLASRTPVVQTQARPPQVNSSPAAGELLQGGVRRALRRSSGRSELLKPRTARRCVCCQLLPSTFGFAPSLPYVPAPVTSPLSQHRLWSSSQTCRRGRALLRCCHMLPFFPRMDNYSNISSHSMPRPLRLGDLHTREGAQAGYEQPWDVTFRS